MEEKYNADKDPYGWKKAVWVFMLTKCPRSAAFKLVNVPPPPAGIENDKQDAAAKKQNAAAQQKSILQTAAVRGLAFAPIG